jgi:predicted lipoprotein with Yx(FWY)xxD motif
MRRALVVLPATLAIAGCGASGIASTSMPVSAPTASASAKHAVVKTRHGALGTFLVDGRGRTLYLFRKDTTRTSRCSGACAQNWPPLITREKPEAEGGAKQSLLSTSRRKNGSRQVVYNGHPLYRFIADSAPGDTTGQGLDAFGARWFVVSPSGRAIKASAATTPGPGPYTY